ncbi:MAG: ABC transporter substrate-binding protein [Candidatus Promineifilaceae bacterium]|nr:ABC transporter substrate-binding protein [Candidatus Promineifilaceae bacterium]
MTSRTLGRYELIRELGRGGMATVYLARDPAFDRQVAIKVLPAQFLHDPRFYRRFEREAKSIGRLAHPAIVPVHDYGEDRGVPYLVMGYMRGGSLADRLRSGPLDSEQILAVVANIAAALDAAHAAGLVHRDIKPANILFDAHDNAYLSDFGIVKMVEATTILTNAGVPGTPEYLSPEQARGDKLDGRSDVYSLAVMVFALLSGRPPYESDTPFGLAYKHINDPVPDIRQFNANLPPAVQAVIEKGMAKNRDFRYPSAGAFHEALHDAFAGQASVRNMDRTDLTMPPSRPPESAAAEESSEPGRLPLGLPLWALLAGGAVALVALVAAMAVAAVLLLNEGETATPLAEATVTASAGTLEEPKDDPGSRDGSATAAPTEAPASAPTLAPTEAAVAAFEPATVRISYESEPEDLDPLNASQTRATLELLGNLFVGLGKIGSDGQIAPYLARGWDISGDGLTWTFYLRDDIPWVRYNSASGQVEPLVDDAGEPRKVTAHDFVFSVRRWLGALPGQSLAPIVGSEEAAAGEAPLTEVGVVALDNWTVQVTLEEPAAYLPAMLLRPHLLPVSAGIVEGAPDSWHEPAFLVSSGPFALASWERGVGLTLVKNPFWPAADDVQSERIEVRFLDAETALAEYEAQRLETMLLPNEQIVPADLENELHRQAQLCTLYVGFTRSQSPTDNINLRRALIQATPTEELLSAVLPGSYIRATSVVPPGVFGAPESSTLGLPFDPEAALAWLERFLAESGLELQQLNEQGLTMLTRETDNDIALGSELQAIWREVLGIDVEIESRPFQEWVEILMSDEAGQERPDLFRAGACVDASDADSFLYLMFHAEGDFNWTQRGCTDETCSEVVLSEFDRLLETARRTDNPDERLRLYEQAEQILAEEEAAYLPLYHSADVRLVKPWLRPTFATGGFLDLASWRVDTSAQQGLQE